MKEIIRHKISIWFSIITIILFVISCGSDDETNPVIESTRSTVTDIDGNVYETVSIGTQVWMTKNLKVNHFRNGDVIPIITSDSLWLDAVTAACCSYDNNEVNVSFYGKIYNWFAVNDSRGITPSGWHVPTDSDWQKLIDYLGGENVASNKMREIGITHWDSPNTGANNESGFTALPGGYRYHVHGGYVALGSQIDFWSSISGTGDSSYAAWDCFISTSSVRVGTMGKNNGSYIRCIKD